VLKKAPADVVWEQRSDYIIGLLGGFHDFVLPSSH
jgi:hypothetical protein